MSVSDKLTRGGIAPPPAFLPDNVHYETIMGSVAYGVSADTSDLDVYGFCIPPKVELFPHLRGKIVGLISFCRPQNHPTLNGVKLSGFLLGFQRLAYHGPSC